MNLDLCLPVKSKQFIKMHKRQVLRTVTILPNNVGIAKRAVTASITRKSSSVSDPDVLHKSIVPTHHFQKSLPRLPVPKLEDTCMRYLRSQHSVLTPEQHAATTTIVENFQKNEGKELHAELVASNARNKHTSYISAPWSEMYLKDRRAVALNHNPFIAFNDDPNKAYNDQVIRATNFVISSMKFLKTYRGGHLEPEVYHLNPSKSDNMQFRKFVRMLPEAISFYGAYWYKAFPLDMSQFPQLFNTTRIPRPGKDELFSDENAKHLVVLRNGHFYTFDVFDKNGNILPGDEILANMTYIVNDSRPPAEHPIGVFTTQDRNYWADVREKLVAADFFHICNCRVNPIAPVEASVKGNSESLRQIDSALFALVLDDEFTEDPVKLSKSFLHGGDGTNRWFDKSFSLILNKSGKACVNFEHAWGDGVAVLRYFNEIFKDSTQSPRVHPDTKPSASADPSQNVSIVEIKLTDELKNCVKEATQKFQASTDSLHLTYHKHDLFGKNFLKEQKFSPDSFMQLAIQMAYKRLHDATVPTYESCSTAAFKHGRTETIRPATDATKHACELFASGQASVDEMKAAMDECSKMHGQLTKEAAMGQGFDRHLFAMKDLATKKGDKLPELYHDPAYAYINNIILSTSTLSSPAVLIGGFCPVIPDGFGIGYGIDDNNLGCVVTTYPARNGSDFLECFKQSIDDMHDVLLGKHFNK